MRFEPDNNNNTLYRIINYLRFLIVFCMSFGFGSLFSLFIIKDLYFKGVYAGIAMFGLLIAFGTISFLMSLVPKEDIDEIYKMLEEELEKRKDELRKKKEELKNKDKKKDGEREQDNS